jgi:hypothetical protein
MEPATTFLRVDTATVQASRTEKVAAFAMDGDFSNAQCAAEAA